MTLQRIAASLAACALTALLNTAVHAQSSADLTEANRLYKAGQPDRALERVNAFLKASPKDARGRFLKGILLAEQKKPEDAIKVFLDLTHDFPELPEPYNNLAVLYAAQGQYDKARGALEMAIRTHPSYATAHENLGDIYAKMASQAYDKALQLDKSNRGAQTKLNLIKDLFSTAPQTTRVASASAVDKAVPPPKPAPAKAEPAAKAKADPASPAPTAKTAAVKPEAAAKGSGAAVTVTTREKPPAAKPAAEPAGNTEVLAAVDNWARAWSGNDVTAYLSAYAADFKVPGGETRAQWEKTREARIAKPRKIELTLADKKVVMQDSNTATVTFMQHYRSGAYKTSGQKILTLVKAGGKWLIKEEVIGQ